jgi:CO/xanthine dehydrogenase FAD-binding subunit
MLASEIDPPSDHHASAEYRRHAATVLCRRALAAARTRIPRPEESEG